LKRGGKVYTQVILGAKTDTLTPIIRQKIKPDSVVYTDCWKAYSAVDVSEFKHYRINHSTRFAKKHNYISGIENFWNQAKRHMSRFNGIPRNYFNLLLKECECRFNTGTSKELLAGLKYLLKELY
jgi:transposase